MKLHHVVIVAVVSLTVLTGDISAQERLFGNGRFLKRLRDDLTGRRSPEEKPPAKSKAASKSKPQTPKPATRPKTKAPTPAKPEPKKAQASRKAPAAPRNVPTYKPKWENRPDSKAPVEATRSGDKQTLAFGMLIEARGDKFVLTQIDPKGNATKTGLKKGDEITNAAGIKLESMDEFNQITEVLRNGDQIEFEYIRRGKKGKGLVMYGEMSEDEQKKGQDVALLDDVEMIEPADLLAPAAPSFEKLEFGKNDYPKVDLKQDDIARLDSKPTYDFVPAARPNSGSKSVLNQNDNSYNRPYQPRKAQNVDPNQKLIDAERRRYEQALEQQRLKIERLNDELRRLRDVVPPVESGNSILEIPDLTGPSK